MSSAKRAYSFITDIHGNDCAFEAVLEDIAHMKQRAEVAHVELVCLGDSFDGGPDPVKVFGKLRDLDCTHLRGNHEDYLFQCKRHPEDEKFLRPLWKFVPWTVKQMGSLLDEVETQSVDRWAAGCDPLFAVHASLRHNNRVPDFFTHQAGMKSEFREFFSEQLKPELRFFFNGHSHYLGRHSDLQSCSIWFNCGSVGYPFVDKLFDSSDAPLATWVWVEVEPQEEMKVIHRRVPYSSDLLLRRYVESGALEECAPFSFAVAAQSLFNQDVVYPFFQSIKKSELTPSETANLLLAELQKQNVFERINRLLCRAGLPAVRRF